MTRGHLFKSSRPFSEDCRAEQFVTDDFCSSAHLRPITTSHPSPLTRARGVAVSLSAVARWLAATGTRHGQHREHVMLHAYSRETHRLLRDQPSLDVRRLGPSARSGIGPVLPGQVRAGPPGWTDGGGGGVGRVSRKASGRPSRPSQRRKRTISSSVGNSSDPWGRPPAWPQLRPRRRLPGQPFRRPYRAPATVGSARATRERLEGPGPPT